MQRRFLLKGKRPWSGEPTEGLSSRDALLGGREDGHEVTILHRDGDLVGITVGGVEHSLQLACLERRGVFHFGDTEVEVATPEVVAEGAVALRYDLS